MFQYIRFPAHRPIGIPSFFSRLPASHLPRNYFLIPSEVSFGTPSSLLFMALPTFLCFYLVSTLKKRGTQ